jgi:hypothetical protein
VKGALRASDGVLVLTIASSMSATHDAAVVAAQSIGGPVRVVDTKTAGGAGRSSCSPRRRTAWPAPTSTRWEAPRAR